MVSGWFHYKDYSIYVSVEATGSVVCSKIQFDTQYPTIEKLALTDKDELVVHIWSRTHGRILVKFAAPPWATVAISNFNSMRRHVHSLQL